MKTVINTTEKTVNKRNVNAQKNSSKLAQTKAINLLNEVIKQDAKEQKKQEQEQKKQDKLERLKQQTLEKGNFNRVVNNTNKIFKQNFVSLGYLLKIVDNEKEQVMQEQKQDSLFNEYDEIKLNKVFEIIKLARKKLGIDYGWFKLLWLGFLHLIGKSEDPDWKVQLPKGMICSQLVSYAYLKAGFPLKNLPPELMEPTDLDESDYTIRIA
jgi:hypothetical protein